VKPLRLRQDSNSACTAGPVFRCRLGPLCSRARCSATRRRVCIAHIVGALVPTATSRSCRAVYSRVRTCLHGLPHRRIRSSRPPFRCDDVYNTLVRLPPAACNLTSAVSPGSPGRAQHRRFRSQLRSPRALRRPSSWIPPRLLRLSAAATSLSHRLGLRLHSHCAGITSLLHCDICVEPCRLRDSHQTTHRNTSTLPHPCCDILTTPSPLCGRLHGYPRPALSGRHSIGGDNGTWHVQCRLPRPACQ
jgi:hypothetical protein